MNTFFPFNSVFLDRLNRVHRFVEYLKGQDDVPVYEARNSMYQRVAEYFGGGPIEYLEFGVFQGESITWWSKHNAAPESRFVGFDSFEGLPEQWWGKQAGHFTTQGRIPDIKDSRVRFVKGWFQHTMDDFLKEFSPRHRLVINNDSDLFSSTLYTLTKLDKYLVPGTIIIFDEFDDIQHEFRALEDYCSAYLKKFKLIAGTNWFGRAALEVVA